jgi:hypothetical protein
VPLVSADWSYAIPSGTGARLDQGKRVEILPARIDAHVGQVIRIVNHDSRGYLLGPFSVGAHETCNRGSRTSSASSPPPTASSSRAPRRFYRGSKSELVKAFVRSSVSDSFTFAEVKRAAPGASDEYIRQVLRELRDDVSSRSPARDAAPPGGGSVPEIRRVDAVPDPARVHAGRPRLPHPPVG